MLLSIAILSAGAVLIMQALARGAYALSAAETRTDAYAFSAAKLADLELGFTQGLLPKPSGQFKDGNGQIRWHVDAAPFEADPGLQLMTLTVGWSQAGTPYETRYSLVRRIEPEEHP